MRDTWLLITPFYSFDIFKLFFFLFIQQICIINVDEMNKVIQAEVEMNINAIL